MKKEEVTKWLTIMKANLNSFPEVSNAKKIEALGEAIRLFKNEQSKEPSSSENSTSSDDCISRFEVTEILNSEYDIDKMLDRVDELPSVTPIRLKGHWIPRNAYLLRYKCSECNYKSERYNYCPNCGAEMCEVEE